MRDAQDAAEKVPTPKFGTPHGINVHENKSKPDIIIEVPKHRTRKSTMHDLSKKFAPSPRNEPSSPETFTAAAAADKDDKDTHNDENKENNKENNENSNKDSNENNETEKQNEKQNENNDSNNNKNDETKENENKNNETTITTTAVQTESGKHNQKISYSGVNSLFGQDDSDDETLDVCCF